MRYGILRLSRSIGDGNARDHNRTVVKIRSDRKSKEGEFSSWNHSKAVWQDVQRMTARGGTYSGKERTYPP